MRLLQLPVNPKEIAAKKAGASTQKALRTWQKQQQLSVNPNQLLDTVTTNALAKSLQGMGYLDTKMRNTVSGKVTHSEGTYVPKIRLLAFDMDLKGIGVYKKLKFYKQLLALREGPEYVGEAVSDAQGFYEVVYYEWMFTKSERKRADIVVFAIKGDAIIGRSRLVQNAPRSAQDVAVTLDETKRTKGIYKPLYQQVASFLKDNGLKIAELGEEAEYISFVAAELGLEELQLQYLLSALALNNTVKARLEPELLFGLANQDIPLNWERIAAFSKEVLLSALQEAIAQKNIDSFSKKALSDFVALLQSCALEKTLEPTGSNPNITDDLLKISLPKKQDRVQFLTLKKEFEGTDENEFWNDFLPNNSTFAKSTLHSLQTNDTLFKLSGFHPPLVKEISKNQPQRLENLVQWDTDRWTTLIKKADVPKHIPGKTKNQKIKNYGEALQKAVNTRFVSAALQHKIKTKQVPVNSTKIGSCITKFLSKTPEFDIKTGNIREQEDRIKTMVGPDEVLQQQVLEEINAFQRMVRINPDTSLIGPMKTHGLTSAMAIAEYPRKTFALQFESDFGGEQQALAIYDTAVLHHAESHRIATGIGAFTDRFLPGILGRPLKPEWLLEKAKERFPGYSKVFDVALCECQHCNSVYGPSAYFVDLMRYLERGAKKDGKSPLAVFQERRPDLFHLALTCENANTLVPYIDLANEVMENYIFYSHNDLADGKTFEDFESADTSNLTAEELRAQPQHIQKESYKKLSEKVYPLTMPFHLPLETLRSYAQQLGTSWHTILDTLNQTSTAPETLIGVNAAYLNLSTVEWNILAGETVELDTGTAKLYHYYGYNGASGLKNLHKVPTFLAQTQLTYVELVSLLKTKYLNPGLYKINYLDFIFKETSLTPAEIYSNLDELSIPTNTIAGLHSDIREAIANNHIKPNKFKKWIEENFDAIKNVLTLHQDDTSCTLATTSMRTIMHIYKATTAPRYLSNAVLQKLHAFIRLWRKLGWSIQDFDTVVTSFGTSTFDQAFLNKLSYAKQFVDTTALTPKKAAALWGTIDYRADNNLYADLFLRRTQEIPDAFVPTPERILFSELTTTAEAALSNFTEVLLSAFGISEIALMAIYSGIPGLDTDERISIENISTIYRHVLFASVLDIPVRTLMQYLQLLDIDPFTDPKSALDGYHTVQKMTSGGFTPKWLAYVLQDDAVQYDDLVFGETAIQKSKQELLKKYVEIEGKAIALEEGQSLEDAQNDLKREATYDYLANLVSVPVQILKALLEKEIGTGTLEDFIDNPGYSEDLNGLARAASVVQKFSLEAHEVLHFVVHKVDFEDLDLTQLNRNGLWQVYRYNQLKNEIEKEGEKLTEIFTYAVTTNPGTVEELLATIDKVTSWDIANIKYLLEHLFTDIADFKNTVPLTQMSRMIGLANSMGVTVASLNALKTEPNPDFEMLWDTAQKVKLLLKAKYEHSTWVKVATKLNDQLRELQRDALVAYCLTLPSIRNHELEVKDANGLYEYFLLDVQMSACMDTSRMVQASAAIQQFVNRSHLNLEKQVKVEALDRGRWLWMQHYRVWEAQMRVWYENETLLNPEWRMDKTPFFKELESYLTQNDITDRTAEEALRSYVRRMDEVSNLNVAGMYEEKDEDGNLKIVHVFGHTNSMPYIYYYRTFNEFGKWSAWEKVDTAIQAVSHSDTDTSNGDKKTGVHLIPVVWKNRLFLFWPEFMPKEEPVTQASNTTFKDLSEESVERQKPKKYWEVRLAWSEYFDGKWAPKQVSETYFKQASIIQGRGEKISLDMISFHSLEVNGALIIYLTPFTTKLNIENPINSSTSFLQSSHSAFRILNIPDTIDFQIFNQNLKENISENLLSAAIIGLGLNISGYFNNQNLIGKYSYNFQTTGTKESQLILGKGNEIYLEKEDIEHRLIFSNRLEYQDNPNDYAFFYSSLNKKYFVYHTKELIVQRSEGFQIGDSYFPGHVRIFQNSYSHFTTFHHPYVNDFIQNLNTNGVFTDDLKNPGLLDSDLVIGDDRGTYFKETFDPNFPLIFEPTPEQLKDPKKTYFKETVDFDPNGANSQYNWELFYHAPLYIATQLSKNGQFKAALKWFHYLFDPTTDAPVEANEIARFFKVKPFKTIDPHSFEKFIEDLEANPIGNEENKRIKEWRENPFNPHLIASNFPVNYMKHLVLAYVENLVHWGDSLFRRFTRENVYEAIQLYVIAGHILGPKPRFIPKRGVIKKETYTTIQEKLNDLSNAYVSLENSRPYSSTPSEIPEKSDSTSLLGNAPALYFCTPPNKRLLKYWDLVEDRLYKIRNCKDINGIARRLALFAPPIDPAALIKAKSAGLDLDDIIGNLNTSPPHYRFMYLLQKANEFCNDVKALGAAVLSAIEKEEGETLSQIRSAQEVDLLGMVQRIRERQVLDAKTAKELLEKQRETALFRFAYYNETMLGNEAIEIPSVIDLELDLDENSIIPVNPDIQEIVPDVNIALHTVDESGLKILSKEKEDLRRRETAMNLSAQAGILDIIGGTLALIPQFTADGKPLGVGAGAGFGGRQLSAIMGFMSNGLKIESSVQSQKAALSSTTASYIRREQDWTLQANFAAKEVQQLERQILSAGIRVQIAEKELENHKQQIANAETIESYIKTKFSNKELYQWMKEQLVSVHKQSYDMAFELARKAEMAFEYEKGTLENPIVGYGHFESSKSGLLAGEKLQLTLRRLELAYQEKNTKELELTKHISLQLLDPLKLIMLRETGRCSFELFEELFDLDYPGHYNRRIKSVSLSIPCITGPHTTIACTLRQTSGKVRVQADASDEVVLERRAPVSKVATSTGQNDSGVYELNFRDERYLPFEGSGAISAWDLELFHDADADDFGKSLRQFDYTTIADVVLHMRYTAVEEGEFKTNRINALKQYLNGNSTLETEDGTKTLHLLKAFNLKQDFPSEWHKMLYPNDDEGNILSFKIKPDHFPYRDKGQILKVNALHVIARTSDSGVYMINVERPIQSATDVIEMSLAQNETYGGLHNVERNTSSETIEIDFSSENLWNLEVIAPTGEPLGEEELRDLLLILEYSWK